MKNLSRIAVFFIAVGGVSLSPGTVEARHIGLHLEYFSEFSYSRRTGSWHLDEVFEANITFQSDGTYTLEMFVIGIGGGFPPEPDCLESPLEPPLLDACAKPVKLKERALTAGEVAKLMRVFRGFELVNVEDPICPAVGAPLRVDHFRWDSVIATDFFCSPPYVPAESANEIVDLLRHMRDGGRDCNQNAILDVVDLEGGSSSDNDKNGVPDECQPSFQRADSNSDTSIDLSDAIHTLAYLFRGEGEIACPDAADSNDDGTLDISDPIHTLSLLFLRDGLRPACGIDLTEDELECLVSRQCP